MRCQWTMGLWLATFTAVCTPSSHADTLDVPASYGTIQAAMDAAANGDVVLVAPGTYQENLDFKGKAITVTSSGGATVTILDGSASPQSVVTFQTGEGSGSTLDGFHLKNGTGVPYDLGGSFPDRCGGGIFCADASPRIINNILSENSVTGLSSMYEWYNGLGAGIFIDGGQPVVANNLLFDNRILPSLDGPGRGAGIYCHDSTAFLTNNTITNNHGSGLGVENGAPTLSNTILWNNFPEREESNAQIQDLSSAMVVTNCLVEGGWTGNGIVDANPRFLNPFLQDYHVVQSSPCVDAGDNSAPGLQGTDWEGDTRSSGLAVDIGADEFTTPLGAPGIRHVPTDHSTIQAALDAAYPADEVVVSAGTYLETLNFHGKVVTVRGEDGPFATIIDGQQSGSVVQFVASEGRESVLEGVTITGGLADRGGGILCLATSPTIRDCIVHHNEANQQGGGLYADHGTPWIEGNTFHANAVVAGGNLAQGGGLRFGFQTDPVVLGNRITQNTSITWGGGISLSGSQSTALVEENWIEGNTAVSGGGLLVEFSVDLTLRNNHFLHNSATLSDGGALRIGSWSPVRIEGCVFHGNSAGDQGGVIYAGLQNDFDILHCTVTDNSASLGGVMYLDGADATVRNSILWNNGTTQAWLEDGTWGTELSVEDSVFDGGAAAVHLDGGSILNLGSNVLQTDPMLVDLPNGDVHLTWSSPCRDTANGTLPDLPNSDFESDPRAEGVAPDMGADEFHPHLYWTGQGAPGGAFELKVVGVPGTAPVVLFVGSGVFETPFTAGVGLWWLVPPFVSGPLPVIPANGVLVLPATLPPGLTVPIDIPMQTLIGSELSNLSVINVE